MEHLGKKVILSAKIEQALAIACEARKGGFATIHGYVPSTDYIVKPIVNINFTSRFSYTNILEKKNEAMAKVRFEDVSMKNPKLSSLSIEEQKKLFIVAKGEMSASAEKTLCGVREDAHRVAHDTFYVPCVEGVKVKLKTQKIGSDTVLVEENGCYIGENVSILAMERSRVIVKEGEKKVINSQAKTIMKQEIERAYKDKDFRVITFALKEDNFDSLKIGGNEITN